MRTSRFTVSVLTLLLIGCAFSQNNSLDKSSWANLDEVWQTALHLKTFVNFNTKTLNGSVVIDMIAQKATQKILLDINKLTIYQVYDIKSGNTLKFKTFQDPKSKLGGWLEITYIRKLVPQEKFTLEVYYRADTNADSNQWLTPEMTRDNTDPFFYTQNEAINSRSIVPCQDTPAVKIPIKATITCNLGNLKILFGGKEVRDAIQNPDGSKTAFFEQSNPIPTYLIAIAIGKLESRIIIPDLVSVWAEPSLVATAANEFVDIKTFIEKAEDYMGFKYGWGKYDILVLPPAFPYGGMENPNLTFLTPSVIAGDRSLVNVLAHELAHSWTGNLVTNQNWDNFWLNEGFTVFFERKILQLSSKNGDDIRKLSSEGGLIDVTNEMKDLYKTDPKPDEYKDKWTKFTHLYPDIRDSSPDESFSTVPYEKGYNLLYWLESLVGEDNFKTILRTHVLTFKGKTATADKFKDIILIPQIKILITDVTQQADILKQINDSWDNWINNDLWNGMHINDFSKFNYL